MKRLSCHIICGSLEFRNVETVEIRSSWKDLTDTARIVLPRNAVLQQGKITDFVQVGSYVEVNLGYDGDLNNEFTGTVNRIYPGTPWVLECEDQMARLKRVTIEKEWESVGLRQFLQETLPGGIQYEAVNTELGRVRIDGVNLAKVLEKFRQRYGFHSYFRSGILYCGFPYGFDTSATVEYHFQRNVISNGLTFEFSNSRKLKVKATSIYSDNSKAQVTLGDPDGELRTRPYFNVSKADLRRFAEEYLKTLRYDGYSGSMEAFGAPFVQHGYRAKLVDGVHPERAGTYFLDRVNTRFGVDGFRRELTIGRRVS